MVTPRRQQGAGPLRLGFERVRGPATGGRGCGGERDGSHARPAFLPAPGGQPLQEELRHRARARQPPTLLRVRRRADVEPGGVAEQARDGLLELLLALLQPAQRAASCNGEPAQRGAHAHGPRERARRLAGHEVGLPFEVTKLGLVRRRCTCQPLEHGERRSTRRAAVAVPRLAAAWGGSEAEVGGQVRQGQARRVTDLPRRSGSSTTLVARRAAGRGPSRHSERPAEQAATRAGGSRA
eukprot:scaffold23655_cov65-Phaeocystis_antarctica.AAC.5